MHKNEIIYKRKICDAKNFEITFQATDDILKQAIKLDKTVFSKRDVGNFETCKAMLKENNDMYTFLLYDKKCVGYVNFIRISDEAFKKFLAGKMKDFELTTQDILPFSKKEKNKCLLTSIVVAKSHRDSSAIIKLNEGFYDHLNVLKRRGIIIDEVVIDCVSIDGIKYVVENMGAKYVCDSFHGKIYHTYDIYNKLKPPKIDLEMLNNDNLKVTSLIQYEIFNNNWCGYCDLLSEVKGRQKYPNKLLPITYLVKYRSKAIGIIGLYELKNYKNTIWLNWFGILPEYRNRGFGTHALFKIIEIAREYNRKEFRLVTYKNWNYQAQNIYQKTMQLSEYYKNKDDWQYAIENGIPMIFSTSLFDKTITKWNNKFVDLLSDEILHKKSIKKLKKDGLI